SALLGLGHDLVLELLFLVLNEPADHLTPKRFAHVRRDAFLFGELAHPVENLLVAPGHVGFLAEAALDFPSALHVAEALGDPSDAKALRTCPARCPSPRRAGAPGRIPAGCASARWLPGRGRACFAKPAPRSRSARRSFRRARRRSGRSRREPRRGPCSPVADA